MKTELKKMTTPDVRKLINSAGKSRSPAEFLLAKNLNKRVLWSFHIRLPSYLTGTRGSPKHVFKARDLRKLGYSPHELAINHYKLQEIIEAGYPLHELLEAVKNPNSLEKFGFSKKEILKAEKTAKTFLDKMAEHKDKLESRKGASGKKAIDARLMHYDHTQKEINAKLGKQKKKSK